MHTFKWMTCPECKQKVNRHDANRIKIKVAAGCNGQGVFKDLHLACYQKKTEGGIE